MQPWVTMHDTRRLAQSAVDQIEVGLPAVSLVVLPVALDLVAVVADGRGEALVERLALAPQLPLAVADAHLVDAANVPVVAVELVVAAVGGVAVWLHSPTNTSSSLSAFSAVG